MKERLIKVWNRVKKPQILGILAVGLYQFLKERGIIIELTHYQTIIDTLSYLLLGYGVYSTHDKVEKEEE